MSYNKHVWVNNELPAINATNLNNIENGLEEAHNNFANYKLNGDFAIVTGTIECTNTENYTNKTIDYPTGFTKDNCVVVSFGSGGQSYNGGYAGLSYGFNYSTTTGYLTGAQDRNVFLNSDNITIMYYNPTPNQITYDYQIVLMKISEVASNE